MNSDKCKNVDGSIKKPWCKPVVRRLSLTETKEGIISAPVENPLGFGILGTNV